LCHAAQFFTKQKNFSYREICAEIKKDRCLSTGPGYFAAAAGRLEGRAARRFERI
jgi:hypothetical protein